MTQRWLIFCQKSVLDGLLLGDTVFCLFDFLPYFLEIELGLFNILSGSLWVEVVSELFFLDTTPFNVLQKNTVDFLSFVNFLGHNFFQCHFKLLSLRLTYLTIGLFLSFAIKISRKFLFGLSLSLIDFKNTFDKEGTDFLIWHSFLMHVFGYFFHSWYKQF